MRSLLIAVVCALGLLVNAGRAAGEQGSRDPSAVGRSASAADNGDLPADAPVDTVLDALNQRGKTLKGFVAKLSDTSGDPNLGDARTRTGKIWFQQQADGSSRFRVLFDKKITGRFAADEKLEYLLEGPWLTDRDHQKKIEVKRQVLKPGEKVELLKLGGPFPLPIGQDKADVHRLFDVAKVSPEKDDPANTIHLLLKPKPDTEFTRKFKSVDVWVDRKSHMPVRVATLDANEAEQHVVELTDLQINPADGLTDADFKLLPIDAGAWNLRTEPYRQ